MLLNISQLLCSPYNFVHESFTRLMLERVVRLREPFGEMILRVKFVAALNLARGLMIDTSVLRELPKIRLSNFFCHPSVVILNRMMLLFEVILGRRAICAIMIDLHLIRLC